MKGYGTIREVKTAKSVSISTDKGESIVNEFTGSYNWARLHGKIEVKLKVAGKSITLLELDEADYARLGINVKANDEIKEVYQKQIDAKEILLEAQTEYTEEDE